MGGKQANSFRQQQQQQLSSSSSSGGRQNMSGRPSYFVSSIGNAFSQEVSVPILEGLQGRKDEVRWFTTSHSWFTRLVAPAIFLVLVMFLTRLRHPS
jgi:hypothetical protein